MDITGQWHHLTVPSEMLDEVAFTEGLDCRSNFRGWEAIREYDLRILPIAETAFIDPFCKQTTLVMLCELFDPLIQATFIRDPRHVARKATGFLLDGQIGEET